MSAARKRRTPVPEPALRVRRTHRNPLVRLTRGSPPVRRKWTQSHTSHKTSHDLRGITAGMRGKTRKIQIIRADDSMLWLTRPLASFAPYSIPQNAGIRKRTCRLTGSFQFVKKVGIEPILSYRAAARVK